MSDAKLEVDIGKWYLDESGDRIYTWGKAVETGRAIGYNYDSQQRITPRDSFHWTESGEPWPSLNQEGEVCKLIKEIEGPSPEDFVNYAFKHSEMEQKIKDLNQQLQRLREELSICRNNPNLGRRRSLEYDID